MALTTSSVSITPITSWQLVATNPNYLQIRNRTSRPWQLAVTSGAVPTSETSVLSFNPQVQNDGHVFTKDTVSSGAFYIRVREDGPSGEATQFGLLIDV